MMRDYKASRAEMYERFERAALLALPSDRFDALAKPRQSRWRRNRYGRGAG